MWCSTVGGMVTLMLSLLAAPLAAEAQQPKHVPRLGFLSAASADRDLPGERPSGRYGSLGEAAIEGVCDPMDHAWLWDRRRVRLAARALLTLSRKGLKAGEGGRWAGSPPGAWAPPGGPRSPVLAHVALPQAWARCFAQGVKAPGRGEARWGRDADEGGCAWRQQDTAERGYRGRPPRLKPGRRQGAPEPPLGDGVGVCTPA